MKPILRKTMVMIALGSAAIGLSGCVYYPSTYGYGYGGGYGGGYAAPAYVAPAPVVTGGLFLGGDWGGGWGGGWGDGDRDGWGGGDRGGWGGRR